jgi:hypothetical protein
LLAKLQPLLAKLQSMLAKLLKKLLLPLLTLTLLLLTLLLLLAKLQPLLAKLLTLLLLPLLPHPLLPSNSGSRNEKPAIWPVFFVRNLLRWHAHYPSRNLSSRAIASARRGRGRV